ncbi:MAG: hypothetical protein R2838_07580 [Caldilineaceae bacterium]
MRWWTGAAGAHDHVGARTAGWRTRSSTGRGSTASSSWSGTPTPLPRPVHRCGRPGRESGDPHLHHDRPTIAPGRKCVSDDRVYAQLIADTIHVHPAATCVLARCKGPARTLLITDAMRAAGLPEAEYDLGRQPVTVKDGQCHLADARWRQRAHHGPGAGQSHGRAGLAAGRRVADHQPHPRKR